MSTNKYALLELRELLFRLRKRLPDDRGALLLTKVVDRVADWYYVDALNAMERPLDAAELMRFRETLRDVVNKGRAKTIDACLEDFFLKGAKSVVRGCPSMGTA